VKLIIAHLPNDALEPVRTELIDLGVLSMRISASHSTSAQQAITLQYRGASLKTHLRAELRLECVAADGQSTAVIDVLRWYAGSTGQVAVLELEELHQEQSIEHAVAATLSSERPCIASIRQ